MHSNEFKLAVVAWREKKTTIRFAVIHLLLWGGKMYRGAKENGKNARVLKKIFRGTTKTVLGGGGDCIFYRRRSNRSFIVTDPTETLSSNHVEVKLHTTCLPPSSTRTSTLFPGTKLELPTDLVFETFLI